MTAATARKRIVSNLKQMGLLELVDGVALDHLCAAIASGDDEEAARWHVRLGLTAYDRTRTGPRPSDDPASGWGKFAALDRPTLGELLV